MFRSQLSRSDGRSMRAIVLVDDPYDAADVAALNPPPGCALLITSRSPISLSTSVTLDPLSAEESVAFLASACPRLARSAFTSEIADLCDRQPFALEIAAGHLLHNRSEPIEEYVGKLKTDRLQQLAASAGTDSCLSVETVFSTSLERLSDAHRQALRLLSVMPSDFSRDAGINVANCDGKILDDLVGAKLLMFRDAESRFATHDLVREISGKQLSDSEQQMARERHAFYYYHLIKRALQDLTANGGPADQEASVLTLVDIESRHINAALAFLKAKPEAERQLSDFLGVIARAGEARSQIVLQEEERRRRVRRRLRFILQIFAAAAGVSTLALTFWPWVPELLPVKWISPIVQGVLLITILGVLVRLAVPIGKSLVPKKILIFGTGQEAQDVAEIIARFRSGFSVLGFVRTDEPQVVAALGDGQVFLEPDAVLNFAIHHRVDKIAVATRNRRNGTLPLRLLLEWQMAGLDILDAASFVERHSGAISLEVVTANWLILEKGFKQSPSRAFFKRVFDIVGSTLLIFMAAPVMFVTGLLIFFESGAPILFRQERIGRQGEKIHVMKFRSMRADVERDGAPRWAAVHDDRITRIGRVIRRLRIDELPQLFSVMTGDMSIVGPRPERPYFVDHLRQEIPFYEVRHVVRPGLTGWAQVRYSYGYSVDDIVAKLEYDLYYVKKSYAVH